MQELLATAIDRFGPVLRSRTVDKGTVLHHAGRVGTDLFLVERGLLRSFHLVKDKDVTAHFASENGIVGAVDSIVHGRASRYCIEALEDSRVHVLDHAAMESFLDENPELERIARRITQSLYADLVERFEGMLFLSAKERYDHLLARYPGITTRVSLGHVASYLGMTQETLSRVRAMGRI